MRDDLPKSADDAGDASERDDLLEHERGFFSNWKSRLPWVVIIAVFCWACGNDRNAAQ